MGFWTGIYHRAFNVAPTGIDFPPSRRFPSRVSAMMMRTGRVLAVIALLNFAGANWILLQSIAWSSRLANGVVVPVVI